MGRGNRECGGGHWKFLDQKKMLQITDQLSEVAKSRQTKEFSTRTVD